MPKTTKTQPKKKKTLKRVPRTRLIPLPPVYNIACGRGLRSWRLWGVDRKGRMIEIGACAAYGPASALAQCVAPAKAYGKSFFAEFLCEDLNQNSTSDTMTVYTIETQGPKHFTLLRDGQPFAFGPIIADNYTQEFDAAVRLCAYANVSIALSATVEKVSAIDNASNPLPLVR